MDPARLEQIEARAIVSMARAAPDDIVAMLDLRTGVAGGAHCVRSHIPDRTFNHAIGIGPDVELDIDALEAWWEGATQPWVVSPLPGSQNESRLRDRGYVDDYAWMKFARPTADPPIPPPQAPAIRVAGGDWSPAAHARTAPPARRQSRQPCHPARPRVRSR